VIALKLAAGKDNLRIFLIFKVNELMQIKRDVKKMCERMG